MGRRALLKALASTGGAWAVATLLPSERSRTVMPGGQGGVNDSATLRTRVDTGGELHFDGAHADTPVPHTGDEYARWNTPSGIKMNATPQDIRLSRGRWQYYNGV